MKAIKANDLLEITLLSIEEYKAVKDHIPTVASNWWLRSPGFNGVCAAYVGPYGSVSDIGYVCFDKIGVRPVFRVNQETLSLPIGEKASVEEFVCTRISEDLLLCDSIICEMPFRKDGAADANNYELSDIKKYLDLRKYRCPADGEGSNRRDVVRIQDAA